MDQSSTIGHPWFEYYQNRDDHALLVDLELAVLKMSNVKFDHMKIAHLGRGDIAVFVAKDTRCTVLYDKRRKFPSSKLLAALILLGSN